MHTSETEADHSHLYVALIRMWQTEIQERIFRPAMLIILPLARKLVLTLGLDLILHQCKCL